MSEESKAGRKIISARKVPLDESAESRLAIAVVDCTPVIYVWRIAYDRVDRPFLAQHDILPPHHILTYARALSWEKTLARRWGVPRGRRGAAA